ncbi:phosphoribosylanthranilate isomerase [Polyangium aurulentum]|uniref:phosphoribosylanthranilate isomerase n=1 Tax=Polyangium aurulentum TaxID=2567896 RepID=UPI0010ADE36E|nr:phosphoribosylanthranilate isomerase [Polyangium aurulentum]UQA55205.1 phosphoribosylanthranilate isomerase [Polyangium aurulentum]
MTNRSAPLRVKICGITRVIDAVLAADAGADMIGLNFVEGSPRRVDLRAAREIAERVRGQVELVGVVADEDEARLVELQRDVGLDWLQLHGDEPPERVRRLLPRAFKAVRVGSAEDASLAMAYPGEILLVDARVEGQLGGTGVRVDPALVQPLAATRRVMLAGGLKPGNVADAVRAVGPWGVDTASGVESAPGIKDPDRVAAFIAAAREAVSS